MPATYIAPGVYSEEIDLSLYAPQLSTSILGLVGVFKKGPVGQITFISTRNQFEQVFGTPFRGEDGFAAHAALYFLRWGNQLKVVRVGDDDVAKSTAEMFDDGTTPTAIGRINGATEGVWADGLQIVIEAVVVPDENDLTGVTQETVYNVRVYDTSAGDGPDSFGDIDFTGYQPLEIWEDVRFDDATCDNYVEKVINGNSLWIEFQMTSLGFPDTSLVYTLAGGNDGVDAIDSTDIIGSFDPVTGLTTGLRAFEDPLVEDINLISAPGWNHIRTIAQYLITLAQTRFDCMAILDTPWEAKTAQNLRDYIKGNTGSPGNTWSVPATNGGAPLASSNRSAIYGPWVKIFDSYNNEEIWVPPSVRVLGVFAFNDNVAYPWFAAAGPNRGLLFNTLDVQFRLSLGDIEYTYGFGVNMNPIQVTVDGILINGNKTLQRKPSLLQNIHIVRMLMYAEKVIATAVRYLQWEPHDEETWRRYTALVSPFLNDIAGKRGITAFRIKCDKDTNTDYYINLGQMVAEIHIIPTNAVAVIINRYIIHPHGSTLESGTPGQQT
jgi:uncharacterized protein